MNPIEAANPPEVEVGSWSAHGSFMRSGRRCFWLVGRPHNRAFGGVEYVRTPSNWQHKRFYSLEAAQAHADRLNEAPAIDESVNKL